MHFLCFHLSSTVKYVNICLHTYVCMFAGILVREWMICVKIAQKLLLWFLLDVDCVHRLVHIHTHILTYTLTHSCSHVVYLRI